MKTTLTIEQSAELIKRGVSVERASKMWVDSPEGGYNCEKNNLLLEALVWKKENDCKPVDFAPIFTLADLLSLLPKHIRIEHRHYYLRMNTFVLTDEENPMWIARYITSNSAITLHERWSDELIDALYKLIISLLDNHVKLD